MPIANEIQIITATSILGLKPSGVETLASTLLSLGLQKTLSANDQIIDISDLNHLYSRNRDQDTKIINGSPLREFTIQLSQTIQKEQKDNNFLLVLRGDCSILIGIMHALKLKGEYGLFFLDAHADFYEPEKSATGEAADMDLAISTGRGPEILTNIYNLEPYVKDENVVHIGQRDMLEAEKYGSQDIRKTDITCFDEHFVKTCGVQRTMQEIKQRLNGSKVKGYWIHFDTDVIDDQSNPAVDYRLPGGLSVEECQGLLTTLIDNFRIVGMSVTIFNPRLDADGKIARRLTTLLSDVLH